MEAFFLAVHYLPYFGPLFFCLSFWQAILFFVIHRTLFGLYLGSVVAPNHIGMLVPDAENPLDFLHLQILSSYNARASGMEG
jgi:hypothetical protein